MKQRILFVGDYNRNDFLYAAKLIHKEVDVFFIEYLNKSKITNKDYAEYGTALFWKDFKSAYALIDKIKPQKVIFYFIESYNHVALNVACKVKKIPTIHLEHGIRFSVAFYRNLYLSIKPTRPRTSVFKRVFNVKTSIEKYKNRQFFNQTVVKSPVKEKAFLKYFFRIRSENNILDTFQIVKNKLRLPDRYISFSPVVFNFHKELEALPDDYPVNYIGIPQFDDLFKFSSIKETGNNVLFIDQPLHEQKYYGWTYGLKKKLFEELIKIVSQLGKQLFIKPHPLNDPSIYNEIVNGNFTILGNEWQDEINETNTILGFSSTLLLPFIAMKSKSCFLLEMHPVRENEPYAQFLLNSNACHAVYNFNELIEKMKSWEYWHEEQSKFKNKFVKNYMYNFDGNSSARLKKELQ